MALKAVEYDIKKVSYSYVGIPEHSDKGVAEMGCSQDRRILWHLKT